MSASSSDTASSLRVLVADDDDDFRLLLISTLEQAGHRVVEIEDGFELGDYLELSSRSVSGRIVPDVIVTDVRMPGRSGLEVVREARRTGLTCPIIVLSAFFDDEVRNSAKQLDSTLLVPKPVDADRVADLVRSVAQR